MRFRAAEPPREVFVQGVEALVSGLGPHGFAALSTRSSARRKVGELTHELQFQSSTRNVRGELVSLSISAGVRSGKLKKWRAGSGRFGTHDLVAGGLLHLLHRDGPRSPLDYTWNLATQPKKELRSAQRALEEVAIPFFDHFREPAEIARRLGDDALPGISEIRGVEVALWLGGEGCAESFVEARLASWSDEWRRRYADARERYRRSGRPEAIPSSVQEQLAAAVVAYGLSA